MASSGNTTVDRQLFGGTVSRAIDATYVTVSFVAIICNTLICLLFYKDKSLRKPFHIHLLNLALSNLLAAITIQPYIWIDFTKIGGNSAASFLCASSVGLVFFMTSALANVLTLSAITVMRYLSIVKNYQGRIVRSKTIAVCFCAMTWMIGIATNIPNGMSFQYNEVEAICYRKWPKGMNSSLYIVLTTLVFGLVPTVFTIACYAALVFHIWKRSIDVPGRNIAAVRARKRVAILVGLLILALILCWSPIICLWVLGRTFHFFSEGADDEYERQRWLRIFTLFCLVNSVLDPFIYIYSCSEYREGIKNCIFVLCRRKVSTKSARVFVVRSEPEPDAKT